jgi:signal peptidase I
MSPTYRNGQLYVFDRSYYRTHPVKRGDVVVLRHGGNSYIKRVLAGPGDSVYLLQTPGHIQQDLVMDFQLAKLRRVVSRPVYRDMQRLARKVVPAGHCLVVGDHLQTSVDSRHFGVIPLGEIIGRAAGDPPAAASLARVALVRGGEEPS